MQANELTRKAGKRLDDEKLDQVSGGCGEVMMAVDSETCVLCGNNEPRIVSLVRTDSTGRIYTYYCNKCKRTFDIQMNY